MSAMMRGNVRMAVSAIRSAKWRSLLTMLGVIVGIVAVVVVVGIGEGLKHQIAGQLQYFGKELITIRPGRTTDPSLAAAAETDLLFGRQTSTGLTINDVKTIQETPGVALAAPLGVVPGAIVVDGKAFDQSLVLATNAHFPEVVKQAVAYGGFWGADEETTPAVVLGRQAASRLFDEAVPLGRSLTLYGQTFMVRGVLDDFPAGPLSPTSSFDEAVFIPYQTAATITQNNGGLYTVLAQASSVADRMAAIAAISERLRDAHGGQEDVTVMSPEQAITKNNGVVDSLTLWIAAVAVVSLIMGGVGIMNIMLLTVTERTHEIGVRKAIGATRRQILSQFMLEATVLSLTGGLIGIVLSLATVGLLYTYTDLKPVISWAAVAIATGVALAIGIVFGVIPALKAASKDPIEALRHE